MFLRLTKYDSDKAYYVNSNEILEFEKSEESRYTVITLTHNGTRLVKESCPEIYNMLQEDK